MKSKSIKKVPDTSRSRIMVMKWKKVCLAQGVNPEYYEPFYLAWTRKNFYNGKFRVLGSLN